MRSDTVTKGKQQAPHRSLFNALGMTQEEMDRPLVGIFIKRNLPDKAQGNQQVILVDIDCLVCLPHGL